MCENIKRSSAGKLRIAYKSKINMLIILFFNRVTFHLTLSSPLYLIITGTTILLTHEYLPSTLVSIN